MRRQNQPVPLLQELQADHHDIVSIREQRHIVTKIHSTIAKKDQEIDSLKALLEKYQGYQHKYSSLKLELAEKGQLVTRKEGECRLLRQQLQEMLREGEDASSRSQEWQSQKQQLVRERHVLEWAGKEAERTFKDYQTQCRRREQQLVHELERAYQANKDQMAKIEDLQIENESIPSLQLKLSQLAKQLRVLSLALEERNSSTKEQTPPYRPNFTESDDVSAEVMRLQQELITKQEELSRQQLLNHELTLEYDETVSSYCGLQSEMSGFRRENLELRQVLGVLRGQGQSQRMEQRYGRGNNSPESEEEGVCMTEGETHNEIQITS